MNMIRLSLFIFVGLFYVAYKIGTQGWDGFWEVVALVDPVSQEVVLVKELPNVKALEYKGNSYIDLGYVHSSSGGKWVGYLSSKTFVELPPGKLSAVMRAGGLSQLPPVPAIPAYSLGKMFSIVGPVVLFVLYFLARFLLSSSIGRSSIDDEIAAMSGQTHDNPGNDAPRYAAPSSFGAGSGSGTFGRR